MLTVTTPATDPWLLTIEQARVLAGLEDDDTAQDESLNQMRAVVSAQIYDALNIAVGNGAEPTIRKERLTERLLVRGPGPILLKRRHNVSVVSISGWSGFPSADTYYVEAEAGIIRAIAPSCGMPASPMVVTIVYDAGFEDVPPVLVGAAADLIRVRRSEIERDPLVKKMVVDVDGVDRVETEFWVTAAGSTTQTDAVPPIILASLKRFRNSIMA